MRTPADVFGGRDLEWSVWVEDTPQTNLHIVVVRFVPNGFSYLHLNAVRLVLLLF